MPNEREVKLGIKDPQAGICSVTGRSCHCGNGEGCDGRSYRQGVDNLPTALVSRLRTLRLHAGICLDDCAWIEDFDGFRRTYPQPEVRDIDRKLRAIVTTLDEVLSKGR